MQHVHAGQKIKASTFNQLIDAVGEAGPYTSKVTQQQFPEPFLLSATYSYDTSTSSDVLSSIAVTQNYAQFGNGAEGASAPDAVFTEGLSTISSIYAMHKSAQPTSLSICTNNELAQMSAEWDTSYKLYDISCDTAAGAFQVKMDYRRCALGSDPKPCAYGTFRWHPQTGTTEGGAQTGTVTQCNFLFGRTPVHLEDIEGVADGDWWLEVQHDSPSSAQLVNGSTGSTPDKTCIPVFKISGQEVVEDWRGAVVVPVWEAT